MTPDVDYFGITVHNRHMQKNEVLNISLPKELLDAIDKQAKAEFRARADLITEATRYYIAKKGGTNDTDTLTDTELVRLNDSLEFAGQPNQPVIILSCAFRPQPNSVKNIFATSSRAVDLMERPPKLRNGGWDLDTQDRARPIGGGFLEVKNEQRKLLRVYRDGQHTFSAGMEFFGHGVNEQSDNPSNFNLLSVAELITNFVTFSKNMSECLENRNRSAIFSIAVSNPQPEDLSEPLNILKLLAYNGASMRETGDGLALDWAQRDIFITTGSQASLERIAYLLYSEFCYFFGVRSDELPYVNKKTQEIDKSKFRWVGR